tara:strand:+ start:74 stop:943 length:870 start_codon:yes stop_codon:yes gene_type:complete
MIMLYTRAYFSHAINLFKLIRLHKPTGIFVLWWPTAWSLWLASQGTISVIWWQFFLGCFLMRSAGCIWNDISDADIDPYVERTANRPIAAKLISKKLGCIYLVIILFLAASIALQLPFNAFILCLLAVGLTLLYPLTKRFFIAPQLFLGFAFGMSVPIAFATYQQPLNLACILLFATAVLWPIIYDTIYALSDKKDDSALNIHSLPLTLQSYTLPFVDLCQTFFVLLLAYLGMIYNANLAYFICLTAYSSIVILQQTSLRERQDYQKIFCSYQWLGGLIMLGLILGISF